MWNQRTEWTMVSHLVVVDEVEVLQGWNDIFFLYARDLADLTGRFGKQVEYKRNQSECRHSVDTCWDPSVYSLNSDLWPLSVVRFEVHEDFQDGLGPVGAVRQQTEIRQRLLRRSRLSFHLGQLITCHTHKPVGHWQQNWTSWNHFCVSHLLNSMSSFP